MAGALQWTAYYTEDGEPWAVFLHGHVSLAEINIKSRRAEMAAAVDDTMGNGLDEAREWVRKGKLGRFYIHDAHEAGEDADEDFPWQFCTAEHSGAIAVTGMRW